MNAAWYSLKEYLIQQSGQVALLVLMVAGLSWLLRNRSAHVRYLLWLVVLAKCLVPPVMTVPLAVLPAEQVIMAEPISVVSDPVPAPVVPMNDTPIVTVTQPTFLELLTQYWLVALWMGGAAAFGLGMILRAGVFHRHLLRERVPAPASLMEELVDLQAQFGGHRSIRAWLTPQASQPFVWGRWRGQVYLPKNFMDQTNAAQRQSILAHELAHILRGDPLVNLIQIIVQALFWFHPLLWWANLQIRREREKCCDEMAIAVLDADVKDYCNTIVDVLVQQCPKRLPLGSVAIAGPVRNIEERIKTMMNPNKRFSKKAGRLSLLLVLSFTVLVVSTSIAFTENDVNSLDSMSVEKVVITSDHLQKLATALLAYCKNHDNELPSNIDQLRGYGAPIDDLWAYVKQLEYQDFMVEAENPCPLTVGKELLDLYGQEPLLLGGGFALLIRKSDLTTLLGFKSSDWLKKSYHREQNEERLERLGMVITRYSQEHADPLVQLSQLESVVNQELYSWARYRINLLPVDHPSKLRAYDHDMLEQGNGTHVLYADGRVEYASLQRLTDLGIFEKGTILVEMTLIETSSDDQVSLAMQEEKIESERMMQLSPDQRERLLARLHSMQGCDILSNGRMLMRNGQTATMQVGSDDEAGYDPDGSLVQLKYIKTQVFGEYFKDNGGVIILDNTIELGSMINTTQWTRRTFRGQFLVDPNGGGAFFPKSEHGDRIYYILISSQWLPEDG